MRAERWVSWLVPVVLLAVALGLVISQTHNFTALVRVWIPWCQIGSLAVLMTLLIVSGGIDLSIGSIVALSAVVMALLWQHAGWPIGWAAAAGVLSGTLAGAVNGQLVVAGLSPLVATLATMAFYRGLALALSSAERVTGFPEWFRAGAWFGPVPTPALLLWVVLCGGAWVLHGRPVGRALYAIGDNRLTARLSGIRVHRLEAILYAANGLLAGLIAVLHTMQHNAVVGDAFQGIELRVIACVVVGGTLITGGQGGMLRTLLGWLVVAHLEIGLELLSFRWRWITPESRLVVIGLLVVGITIWNERWRKR